MKVNFLANKEVSAEDINNIGYNLTNTKYTSFTDGTIYGVDDLNAITANIVTAGVKRGEGDNCAVSLNGSTVSIGSGTAFFTSGVTMEIEANDADAIVELEDSTQTNYVYLFYDPDLYVAGVRCTTAMPSGLEYVLLAEVTDSSVKTNVDRFCKSKVLDAPNTPLVLYNSISKDRYVDGNTTVEEKMTVPNLSQYTMARITCLNAMSFLESSHWHGTGYGDYYNREPSAWWTIPEKVIAWCDFTREYVVVVYEDFLDARNDYKDSGGLRKVGNTVYFTYALEEYGSYPALNNPIALQFDIENNLIIFRINDAGKAEANSVKIELFAGEVQ